VPALSVLLSRLLLKDSKHRDTWVSSPRSKPRDQDEDLHKRVSSALEIRDLGLEITSLGFAINNDVGHIKQVTTSIM